MTSRWVIAIALAVLLVYVFLRIRNPSDDNLEAEDVSFDESQHGVYVHLKLSNNDFGTEAERETVLRLEDDLETLVAASGKGQFDGNEFGGGYAILFMYGPDADALADTILEHVRGFGPRDGSYVIKEYGLAEGSRETRLDL